MTSIAATVCSLDESGLASAQKHVLGSERTRSGGFISYVLKVIRLWESLHLPEEEGGVIRSSASCCTCTSRAPLQASTQTELLCSSVPHGPPSCREEVHSKLSQSPTAQSGNRKPACAHVNPNPNPVMLTIGFYLSFSSGVISTCPAAGMSHLGHSSCSLWALYFLYTHLHSNSESHTSVFHELFTYQVGAVRNSWQPPFPIRKTEEIHLLYVQFMLCQILLSASRIN